MRARRLRLFAPLALGVIVGAAGFVRSADLGPSLTFEVERVPPQDASAAYRLTIRSRGGEVLDMIRVVPPGPWVRVDGPWAARRFRPGVRFVTTLQVTGSDGPARVSVRQQGRVERDYEIDLARVAR